MQEQKDRDTQLTVEELSEMSDRELFEMLESIVDPVQMQLMNLGVARDRQRTFAANHVLVVLEMKKRGLLERVPYMVFFHGGASAALAHLERDDEPARDCYGDSGETGYGDSGETGYETMMHFSARCTSRQGGWRSACTASHRC